MPVSCYDGLTHQCEANGTPTGVALSQNLLLSFAPQPSEHCVTHTPFPFLQLAFRLGLALDTRAAQAGKFSIDLGASVILKVCCAWVQMNKPMK